LQDDASALEEMKADLVSLYVAEALHKQGYYTDEQLKSVYAGGILRVLQNNKPRRDQPYNTMQLMQWNFFLENGLLTFENGKLRIHYDKYHAVVGKLLQKVFESNTTATKQRRTVSSTNTPPGKTICTAWWQRTFATSRVIDSGCSSTPRWASRCPTNFSLSLSRSSCISIDDG